MVRTPPPQPGRDPDDPIARVMMTLSAIAATAAVPRPSGESLEAQSERMADGIWTRLHDPGLATSDGVWRMVWLGVSPGNTNMAYIARSYDGSNQFVVVVRGTVDDPVDTMEDLDVGTLVPFTPAGAEPPVAVSAGAMAAFTRIVNTPGFTGTPAVPDDPGAPGLPVPSGATLIEALAALLLAAPASPPPTVTVTGHSLGGCVATTLASCLQARDWSPAAPRFALVTFAAPTAGPQDFADHVDGLNWSTYGRYFNAWDLVPQAWSDLTAAGAWYPDPPGPAATDEVRLLLKEIDSLRKGEVYVQPAASPVLNQYYPVHDPNLLRHTTADFLGQAGYQHANNTYLALLNAPLITDGPVVTSVRPSSGGTGTPVTVTGTGFGPDSVLDFGTIPCTDLTVDASGTTIDAYAPAGLGLVDVRVTTSVGTSPAVPLGQFAYGGPAPVVVTSVDPDQGRAGDPVVIKGSGFADGATVRFKKVTVERRHVHVESSNRINVIVPHRIPAAPPGPNGDRPAAEEQPRTVDVTVTVGVATSPTGPAGEFTYEDDAT